MRFRRHKPTAPTFDAPHVIPTKTAVPEGERALLPRRSLDKLLAATILHYCQGEARFTRHFLDGLPDSLQIESHVDVDGTLIVRARR